MPAVAKPAPEVVEEAVNAGQTAITVAADGTVTDGP